MIQNIVLDMGNVLLDYDPVRFTRRFVKDEKDVKAVVEAMFSCPDWIGRDLGTCTDEEMVRIACENLPERLHQAAHDIMADYYYQITAFPDSEWMIQTLLDQGYDLYLLSNVCLHYSEMRKHIPLIDRFKGEFLSYQEHLIKPQPEIFEAFCEKFNLNPETCLFVDDVAANVFGAKRIGMQGFWFRGDHHAVIEHIEKISHK